MNRTFSIILDCRKNSNPVGSESPGTLSRYLLHSHGSKPRRSTGFQPHCWYTWNQPAVALLFKKKSFVYFQHIIRRLGNLVKSDQRSTNVLILHFQFFSILNQQLQEQCISLKNTESYNFLLLLLVYNRIFVICFLIF